MGKMRFSYLFGIIIAFLCSAIIVRGQSQTSSTTSSENTEQPEGTPALPSNTGSTQIDSSSTEYATQFDSSSSTQGYVSTTQNPKLSDCTMPTDLDLYCANMMTPEELGFFDNTGRNIMGVLAKILNLTIVDNLQQQCVPGNWCLSNADQEKLSVERNSFYTTPICQSDRLWNCLEYMQITRRECNENELIFVMSSIELMCDMNTIDGGDISGECFTRSMEALHVVYSDFSRNIQNEELDNQCSSYNKQMTNTYACAVNACKRERVFLEDFGPWSHIAVIAESVLETCNMALQCQDGYPVQSAPVPSSTNSQNPSSVPTSDSEKNTDIIDALDETTLYEEINEIEAVIAAEEAIEEIESEMFETTTTYYPDATTYQDSGEEVIKEQGMDIPESQADVDQTFVYGMVTVTVVVVISLTLMGVMAFKRFSRMRKNYKMGYSQMTEEESRMLRNEYN